MPLSTRANERRFENRITPVERYSISSSASYAMSLAHLNANSRFGFTWCARQVRRQNSQQLSFLGQGTCAIARKVPKGRHFRYWRLKITMDAVQEFVRPSYTQESFGDL